MRHSVRNRGFPGISDMSLLVPPTSREMRLETPARAPSSWAATTPATGPDMRVCTGNRAMARGAPMPPLDFIRKGCARGKWRSTVSSMPAKYRSMRGPR